MLVSGLPVGRVKGCLLVALAGSTATQAVRGQQGLCSAPAVGKLWLVCDVCAAVQGEIMACHQNSILRAHLEGRRGAHDHQQVRLASHLGGVGPLTHLVVTLEGTSPTPAILALP